MAKLNITILILFFFYSLLKNNSIYMVLLILKLTLIASLMFLFSYTAFLSCSFTINLCCDSSQFFYGVCFISRSLITFKYFNLSVQVIIFFLQFSAEEVSRFTQIECLNVSSKHAWEKESVTVTYLAAKYLNSTCC